MAIEKFGMRSHTGFRNPPQYVMLYYMVSDIFNDISGMKLDQLDVTFAPFFRGKMLKLLAVDEDILGCELDLDLAVP